MVKKASLAWLIACAGAVCAASGASPVAPPFASQPIDAVDVDRAAFEPRDDTATLGGKLVDEHLIAAGLRGLGVCPSIMSDGVNCHVAALNLGASFSGTRAGAFRVMDNVTISSSNPDRLCWIGRYADRAGPAVADESFRIRIYADQAGLPDLSAPLFERTFRISGAAGVDLLEMDCLDGETCPGTSGPPASGGHYVYSAHVTEGLPLTGGFCYWFEIACEGSSEANLNWGWCGAGLGTDGLSLQAIDGGYNIHTRTSGDRAICVSGGVDPLLGNCVLPPQPPICTNPSTNGIPFTAGTSGGRASWPGSDGRGFWTPFQRADSFSFAAATTVTNVCFDGFWVGVTSTGASATPAVPENPEFRVAYFAHEPNNAYPLDSAPIAEFAVGDPGVSFIWDGTRNASITHPPVQFEADTCYWISIGRIQSTPLPGEPTAALWVWRLTSGPGIPTADNRTATRTVGPGTPLGWGLTIFRTAAPACDPVNSNYVFLFNAGPTSAANCLPPVCSISVPPGAVADPEPQCAQAGNLNGGCNLANPVFTPIACGETHVGSSSNLLTATCGNTRDTDWFHITLTQETEVTVTVNSQFAGIAGYGSLQPGIVNPTGSCAEYGGSISPFVQIGSCTPSTITRTLQPGTWIFFVAAVFGDIVSCDGVNNLYTIEVSCSGGPGPVDCNNNGIPDDQEIAGGARDCYNPLVVGTPHTMGGPDGALDDCQCLANWNRDAMVNSGDITAFLTSWLDAVGGGPTNADVNCDGLSNSGDITFFLTKWLAAVQGSDPIDGCP